MMTRVKRTGLATALGLAACLALTVPAAADEPGPDTLPIHIVAVQTADAYDQAEALTKALRLAIKTVPGWSLGEGDFSLEVLTLSLKCDDIPDASCQSRIADQIKTDRYIWGSLAKKGNNVAGQLHLWVRGQGTSSTPIEYSGNLTEANDEALKKIAADSITALTGGAPKGSIHVRAGTVQGQVFIDGQPVGALVNGEGTFGASSGPHKVLVKAPGYIDVESSVTVKPTVIADVSLSPLPVESSTPPNWRRIGGFVGIGAGVAFGVVGVISSIQVSSVQNDAEFTKYSDLFGPDVDDVCSDENRALAGTLQGAGDNIATNGANLCDKASTFTVLQFIFYPLAAISAGAGAYLLATSSDQGPPRTGWTVQPIVGTETGRLNLTYRW